MTAFVRTADATMSENSPTVDRSAIAGPLRELAPELDAAQVATYMTEHPLPSGESGTHLEWAVRVLRQLGEREHAAAPLSSARVVDELRRHDSR